MSKTKIQAIVIIGAGGHGKELASYLKDLEKAGSGIQLAGFVDENKTKGDFSGSKILGNFEDFKKYIQTDPELIFYITAAGDNQLRIGFVKKIEALNAKSLKPWALQHPKALIGDCVSIGEGTCLCPGSVITTDVNIGKHCIVNVGASVSHDAVIGDFVNLNPGVRICGNVEIGRGSYIGAGATVIDKIKIGENVIVGAGAVVTQDIPDHVTAVGVPARVIKQHLVNPHH